MLALRATRPPLSSIQASCLLVWVLLRDTRNLTCCAHVGERHVPPLPPLALPTGERVPADLEGPDIFHEGVCPKGVGFFPLLSFFPRWEIVASVHRVFDT